MTFLPFPLDPSTPVLDSLGEPPAELMELPQRVRSWSCQTGSALCRDSRCLCTCHTEAANVSTWFGFAPRPRRSSPLAETEHELTGSRDGFRLGFVGPRSLADLALRRPA